MSCRQVCPSPHRSGCVYAGRSHGGVGAVTLLTAQPPPLETVDRKLILQAGIWGKKTNGRVQLGCKVTTRRAGDVCVRVDCITAAGQNLRSYSSPSTIQWNSAPAGQYRFWVEAMDSKCRVAPFDVRISVDGVLSKQHYNDIGDREEKLAFEIEMGCSGKWNLYKVRAHEPVYKSTSARRIDPHSPPPAQTGPKFDVKYTAEEAVVQVADKEEAEQADGYASKEVVAHHHAALPRATQQEAEQQEVEKPPTPPQQQQQCIRSPVPGEESLAQEDSLISIDGPSVTLLQLGQCRCHVDLADSSDYVPCSRYAWNRRMNSHQSSGHRRSRSCR